MTITVVDPKYYGSKYKSCGSSSINLFVFQLHIYFFVVSQDYVVY